MRVKGSLKYALSVSLDLLSLPIMHCGRCHQSQARVVMLEVIPIEEAACPDPGILYRPEPVRVIGTILQGFELCFGIGVVVTDVGSGMGFGHAQIR